MTDDAWNALHYFKKSEAWGNPDLMNPNLLLILDGYRQFINRPIIVDCGTQGAHIENSPHYFGNAVDIKIPEANLIDMCFDALRFPFTGVGLYPDWGLHLEFSNLIETKRLWMGVGNPQKYIALNGKNLGAYCSDYLKDTV